MWLDIPVSNGERSKIIQSFQELEHINLDEWDGQFFFLDDLIEIVGEVVHHHIQILLAMFVHSVVIPHVEKVGMSYHF